MADSEGGIIAEAGHTSRKFSPVVGQRRAAARRRPAEDFGAADLKFLDLTAGRLASQVASQHRIYRGGPMLPATEIEWPNAVRAWTARGSLAPPGRSFAKCRVARKLDSFAVSMSWPGRCRW